jgi:hypothetical protein
MARKATSQNGHDRLDEAMALLIQNQAAFVGHMAENERRFARIEGQMAEIIRILSEHNRKIDQLTEAVREKIGFKAQ